VRKTLLSAAGAFALAAVAFTGSAQAQCWWTGFGYSCAAPPATYYVPYGRTAYPAFNAYDYQDYRLRPLWLPSYPGPRPS
jgi:hypothetical protein